MSEGSFTEENREAIRRLNDALRSGQSSNGRTIITPRVQAYGADFVDAALAKIRQFSAFTSEIDPRGERDFGAVEVYGDQILFKIDHYDLTMRRRSPDPADPTVTQRVLTVLLPGEY